MSGEDIVEFALRTFCCVFIPAFSSLFIFPASLAFNGALSLHPSFALLSPLVGLSWPSLTWKQARLSWQPPVVHMKWCTFIFRRLPFKTIANGLTGAVMPELQIFSDTIRCALRHRRYKHSSSVHEPVEDGYLGRFGVYHFTLFISVHWSQVLLITFVVLFDVTSVFYLHYFMSHNAEKAIAESI